MPEVTNKTSEKMDADEIKQAKRRKSSALDTLDRLRGVLAFVVVFILGVLLAPKSFSTGHSTFLNLATQKDILFEFAEYGILAAGMTLVIIAAGIDLSVGSVLGFAATLFALLTCGYGWSAGTAIAVTVLITAAMGAVNGIIISRFRLQPFVATLGMMLIARGAAKWISGGIKVAAGAQPWYALKQDPSIFDWMTTPLPVVGLQPVTLIFLVSIIILWVVLRFTRFGRYIYAIGGNEEAARLSGIKVGLVKIATYTICGVTSGLAGVCDASRLRIGDPSDAGNTYELDAIAAVVIGGTSLMGGKGGMFFTFLGTLIIAYISKILSLRGVPEANRLMIRGALIVIAVLIQQGRKKKLA